MRGSEKVSLTIPVSEQKNDVDQTDGSRESRKRSRQKLGVFGVEIDEKLAEEVEDLRHPSGRDRGGARGRRAGVEVDLQPGDVIHALNGKPVETLEGLRTSLKAIPVNTP